MSMVSAQKEDRTVFTFTGASYSVRDVIDAAHFRGEVQPHWEEFLARIEAQRSAEQAQAERDDAAIDEAAIAFRYRHDLITAEETERWLEQRGLTLADFSDYFTRDFWATTRPVKPSSPGGPFQQATPELRELFAVELILHGEFDPMAERLSWRVSATAENAGAEASTDLERERFVERNGEIAEWLNALNRDESWFEQTLSMEGAFRRECQKLLTPQVAKREISALRLPLTRFDVETIAFDSLEAAREAVMCVRTDGMSMAEVAQEGGHRYRRTELLLEDIPEELQQKFLSLTPGNVLDPITRENRFEVARVLGKTEPRMNNPAVRLRIEQRILERHFAALSSKHVRWEIPALATE
jgi:hypothetical protein